MEDYEEPTVKGSNAGSIDDPPELMHEEPQGEEWECMSQTNEYLKKQQLLTSRETHECNLRNKKVKLRNGKKKFRQGSSYACRP